MSGGDLRNVFLILGGTEIAVESPPPDTFRFGDEGTGWDSLLARSAEG